MTEVTFWQKARLIGSTVLIYIMALLILWVVYSYATGRSTSNEDILSEMRYQTCILSKPMPERETPQAVVECQEYAETGLP